MSWSELGLYRKQRDVVWDEFNAILQTRKELLICPSEETTQKRDAFNKACLTVAETIKEADPQFIADVIHDFLVVKIANIETR